MHSTLKERIQQVSGSKELDKYQAKNKRYIPKNAWRKTMEKNHGENLPLGLSPCGYPEIKIEISPWSNDR